MRVRIRDSGGARTLSSTRSPSCALQKSTCAVRLFIIGVYSSSSRGQPRGLWVPRQPTSPCASAFSGQSPRFPLNAPAMCANRCAQWERSPEQAFSTSSGETRNEPAPRSSTPGPVVRRESVSRGERLRNFLNPYLSLLIFPFPSLNLPLASI